MLKIQELIRKKEHKHFVFHPDQNFYKSVGINGRRWAKIYRGQIEPTLSEIKSIADYFEVEVTEFI